MAYVEIERDLFDLDLETLLLFCLLNHNKRHDLVRQCYPALFYDKLHREIFKTIKTLDGSADILSVVKTMGQRKDLGENSYANEAMIIHILTADPIILEWQHRTFDPMIIIKTLKDILFRRETLERLQEMSNSLEHDNSDNCRKQITHQANKIQILEHRLLRRSSVSSESIAERTADHVNSETGVIQTGFPFINERLRGLTRRQISCLLAMPGNMKSSFTDCLISRTVELYNITGLIISLEDPTEERVKRIVASRLNLSLKGMRFGRVKLQAKDIERVFKIQLHGKLTIYDTRDILTSDDAVAAINDVKPDLVIVDHIQEFQMPDMIMGLIRAVGDIKAAASRNNCHAMITSQVPDKQIAYREVKAPKASDAQWTSALRQAAAEMFNLVYQHQETHNPFDANYLDFGILKARYADAVGTMRLEINPDQANILREIKTDGSTQTT